MRFYPIFFLLLLISVRTFGCEQSFAKDLLASYQWVTEDYPPYNYIDEEGNLTGIFTDVLIKVYAELNVTLDKENIAIIPWARLYRTLENDDKYAGYSMVNTPERELKFKLVPLPIITKTSIMVISDLQERLAAVNINDLIIAVVRKDIGHQLLKEKNIKAKQVETTSAFSMLKMLTHKRVDAIAYAEDVAYFQYNKLGLNKNSLVPIYILDDKAFSNYIFHRNTPQCIIDLFTETIEKLHQRGELVSVWKKYLNK